MPRRLTRISIAGVGEIVGPPPSMVLIDDTVSSPTSTGLLPIDVLNIGTPDTPVNGIRITGVHASGSLPQANLSIIGAEPAQKVQVNLAGLAAGSYSFLYDGQLIADPTVTGTAVVNLTITAPASIDAQNDSATVVAGGTIDIPVLGNDPATGDKRIASVTPGAGLTASNLAIVGTAPNQFIRANAVGVAAGSYSFTYRAELMLDSSVFDVATVNLTVTTAAVIDAQDDTFPGTVGTGTLDLPVLGNDTGSGDRRITQFTANSPLPQGALSIQGTVPNQFIRMALSGLAAGTYSFSYRAELAADPSVFDVATCTVTLADVSTANVAALSSDSRTEGNDPGANKTWIFGVTRTGDLSLAANVNWALEGTLQANDMPSGQATSGNIAWAAGDGAEQRVVITVIGDTTEEADETVTIKLSSPVNCVIGTDKASLTIADDDTATTTPGADKYDQNLGYGGMMLGVPTHDGQVGNQQYPASRGSGRFAAVMMLESTYPIVAMLTENRYDKWPLGSTRGGYSDKNVVKYGNTIRVPADANDTNGTVLQRPQGADLQISIARVTSAGTNRLTLDAVAGATKRVVRCATRTNWEDDYVTSGGSGIPAAADNGGDNSFVMYPTMWFRDADGNPKPVDPLAQNPPWKIGDKIAFIFNSTATPDNYAGTDAAFDVSVAPDLQNPDRWNGRSRWSSMNMAYRDRRVGQPSTYPLMGNGVGWFQNNYDYENRYLPMMLIGHRKPNGDLLVKGSPWGGYVGSPNYVAFGGTIGDAVRQVLYIPKGWTGRKILAADASVFRTGGSGGSITVSVRRANLNSNGGIVASDDGDLLGSATFTGERSNTSTSQTAGVLQVGNPSTSQGEAHCRVNLTATASEDLKVTDGEAYYVEVAVSAGTSQTYSIGRILNYYRNAIGLRRADNEDRVRNIMQGRNGTGDWATIAQPGAAANYSMFGMSLHFDVSL